MYQLFEYKNLWLFFDFFEHTWLTAGVIFLKLVITSPIMVSNVFQDPWSEVRMRCELLYRFCHGCRKVLFHFCLCRVFWALLFTTTEIFIIQLERASDRRSVRVIFREMAADLSNPITLVSLGIDFNIFEFQVDYTQTDVCEHGSLVHSAGNFSICNNVTQSISWKGMCTSG